MNTHFVEVGAVHCCSDPYDHLAFYVQITCLTKSARHFMFLLFSLCAMVLVILVVSQLLMKGIRLRGRREVYVLFG
jgi:hypothetical protein